VGEAQRVVDLSSKLLDGVTNLKSEEHLQKMLFNYSEIKDEFISYEPKVVRMNSWTL
jgi:hypothetical protein